MTTDENLLLNPVAELRLALETNTFGLTSYEILEDRSFPRTAEEVEIVRRQRGRGGMSICARALLRLLGGEGRVGVRLDQSGWTVEQVSPATASTNTNTNSDEQLNQNQNNQNHVESKSRAHSSDFSGKTYESLETLLIALSPGYGQAMNAEIWRRFGVEPPAEGAEAEAEAEAGGSGGDEKTPSFEQARY